MELDWRTLPPLTTLRAFEATARLKGYSAAARALNVTPAAIAQQVRKLESELGVSLVRRDGRGLRLTDDGEHLARPLHEAFTMIAGSLEDARQRQSLRGVRVSTTEFFGNAVILPNLADLWKRHPGLQTSFSPEGNRLDVDLEKFDIVIRGAGLDHDWPGFQATALIESDMIICGAPGLLGGGRDDLASLPWIQDLSIGGSVFEDMVRRAGCDPDAIELVDPGHARFEIEAALMGYGLIAGPELTLRKHLADGALLRVGPSLGMKGAYYAIYGPAPLPRTVQQFLDWLIDLCRTL